MNWYYAIDHHKAGPVPEEQLVHLVATGQILPETLVWREGMDGWKSLGEVRPELAVLAKRHRKGPRPGQMAYATFGARFGAKMLDWTILQLLSTIVLLLLLAWAYAKQRWMLTPDLAHGDIAGLVLLVMICVGASLLLDALYNWVFLALYQSTPGKMAFGLKVVCADGSKMKQKHILMRMLAERLSNLAFMIGYVVAAFDEPQHRTWHDRLSDTRVVKK